MAHPASGQADRHGLFSIGNPKGMVQPFGQRLPTGGSRVRSLPSAAQQQNVGFQSGLNSGDLPQQIRPNGTIRINGQNPLTV